MKCEKCDVLIYVGDENDPEANTKRISHNEWHHSTQHDNVVRANELVDEIQELMNDLITHDFLAGYVKTDMMVSTLMKIRRFCEDNIQSPVG